MCCLLMSHDEPKQAGDGNGDGGGAHDEQPQMSRDTSREIKFCAHPEVHFGCNSGGDVASTRHRLKRRPPDCLMLDWRRGRGRRPVGPGFGHQTRHDRL